MQGDGVIDAVTKERDIGTGTPGHFDDAGLLVGADPRKHGRGWDGGDEGVVVETVEVDTGQDTVDGQAEVAADLGGNGAVVAGDDLDGDGELVEFGNRGASVGFGPVDEGNEPGEVQVMLIGGGGDRQVGGVAGGDGHDAGPVREEPFHCRRRVGGYVDAAGLHAFGSSFGDQLPHPGWGAHEDRRQLSLVVEGNDPEALIPGDRVEAGVGGAPQRNVERVAPDGTISGDDRLGADQPEHEHVRVWLTVRVERTVIGDGAFGEGAGLVGEQHLDVAEVLDGDETFDQHPFSGQLPRPGRQADAHDHG